MLRSLRILFHLKGKRQRHNKKRHDSPIPSKFPLVENEKMRYTIFIFPPDFREFKYRNKETRPMNIGIRLHDTAGNNLQEHLRAAKAQGFNCVHIAMSKVIPGFRMADAPTLLTDELAQEVRALLAENGQTCALLGCYLNLCSPDLEDHEHTLAIYRAHLRFAKAIGALMVGTETGAPNVNYRTCPECRTEESLRLFIDRVTPVVRYAEEVGVTFAIEPVVRHIVCTPRRCEQVLDALPSDHLRVILDAVNLLDRDNVAQADSVIGEAIDRLGERTALLHMKDYLRENTPQCLHAQENMPNVNLFDGLLSLAPGLGEMNYAPLVALSQAHHLPMTLENTNPSNAELSRRYLEQFARS